MFSDSRQSISKLKSFELKMDQEVKFKPKAIVYISVFLFLFIGTVSPFLIYSETNLFDTMGYIKICVPILALIPSVMAIRKIKTIEIIEQQWTVTYIFTGKRIAFSKNDVQETAVSEHVRYKSGMPYTSWTIKLLSGENIQFSSNELLNSDQIVLHFKRIQKRKRPVFRKPDFTKFTV